MRLSRPFQNQYPCIRQNDIKDCGAACIATIARHHGLKIPITRIREIAGTDKQGTNALGLIKAAEQMGFMAKGVKGNQEAFFSEFPLPAVAHVIVDGKLLHYVVLHRITKKQVIIADPAKGLVKQTPEDFFKVWTGVLILMIPSQAFERGDHTTGTFSRFLKLLLPQKRLLTGIFIISLLFTMLGILGAFYFKFLLDEILPYQLHTTLTWISVGVIALMIFKIVLSSFRSYLLLLLSQKLDINLILSYYRHVVRLPMNFFDTRKTGEVLSRLMDASKVRDAISSAALTIMIDSLMVVAGGVILYMQNHYLFAVAALMIPLYAAIVWGFHRSFERLNRKQMEENASLTSYLVESINGIETVKAYHAENRANLATEKKFVVLLRSVFRLGNMHIMQGSLKGFVQAVGGIVILWVGALQVLDGKLTIGQLITFNALLAYFLEPIQNLINLQSSLQTAIVAADRLAEIMDLEQEKAPDDHRNMQPLSLKGDIDFRQVHFRYGTRELVLKDINLHIRQGEKIAIVGESGSGKTTLAKLLMRFYKSESGDVLIGGNHIEDIQMEALRSRIAYISQETFFFNGTIQENLCLGADDQTSMEELVEAAKLSQAHEFINRLALRYQSLLEENASNLSGGQRQRLALARALLTKPDILILDEATSNLDSTTERAVSETIHRLEGVTMIIIAHRLSTVMRCNRIFVMEQGSIVESGTHFDLLEQRGRYYDLWKDQLPGIESLNAAGQLATTK